MKSLSLSMRRHNLLPILASMLMFSGISTTNAQSSDTLTVKVVALDQPLCLTDLVLPAHGNDLCVRARHRFHQNRQPNPNGYGAADAGQVRLRDDKRPRPSYCVRTRGST